jgi:hypothetical protein
MNVIIISDIIFQIFLVFCYKILNLAERETTENL